MCISMRHPDSKSAAKPKAAHRPRPAFGEWAGEWLLEGAIEWGLVVNFEYSMRAEIFEKLACAGQIEFLVARFDAQEEAVARSHRETLHVERRVIGSRQAVHRQHSKNGGKRRAQNGQFEGDGNPLRPTVVRLAADVL